MSPRSHRARTAITATAFLLALAAAPALARVGGRHKPAAGAAASGSVAAPAPAAASAKASASTAPPAATARPPVRWRPKKPKAPPPDPGPIAPQPGTAGLAQEAAQHPVHAAHPTAAAAPVAAAAAAPPATPPPSTNRVAIAVVPARTDASAPEAPPKHWYDAFELGAFVDTYVQLNYNMPQPQSPLAGGSGGNFGRAYDVHNGFALNWAGLNLAYAPAPVGGTLQLRLGPAAALHNANEASGLQYVKQAFASFKPMGTLTIDAGKFDQPFGSEAADTQANPNYSRSYLYGLAQPYFFTGVRADYAPVAELDFKLELVNGWNNTIDTNAGKAIALQAAFVPSDKATLFLGWVGGPEQPDSRVVLCEKGTAFASATGACGPAVGAEASRNVVGDSSANGRWRHLVDMVADLKPLKPLRLLANADYGTEELGGKSAAWYGANLVGQWQFNNRFAAAARAEYFVDADGAMSGTARNVRLGEGTVTLSFSPMKHALLRLENRADFASESIFFRGTSQRASSQLTTSLSVVVTSAALY